MSTTDPRPATGRLSRRDLIRSGLATGAVASVGTGTVGSLVLGGRRRGRTQDWADAAPIAEVAQPELRVDTVAPRLAAVAPSSEGGAALAAMAAGSGALLAREEGIAPFTVIGVRFASDTSAEARVRVRRRGEWQPWDHLHVGEDHRPDDVPSDGRHRSDPMWVESADAYEIELPGDARDLEVVLVRETDEIAGYAQVPAVTSFAPQPTIHPRSSWSARPVGSIPVAPTVQSAIIHHSAGTNGYSQAQVPGIIRGIQAYHIDGNGWSDIAYNFLVDRFGTLWEGRAGGVAKAVIGGHSYGHNTRTVGICYLGTLSGVAPPAAAVHSITRLVAWKLGLHGVDPRGQSLYTDYGGTTKWLSHVTGHSDVRQTECPGTLYASLGAIRRDARVVQQPFRDVAVDGFYQDAVIWATLIGLTTGVGDTGLFKPDDPVSRAEMATFLHRMMDSQRPTIANRFPDVPDVSFFTTAVRWLDEAGLTTGVGTSGLYQPGEWVTRGQVATFLHRMVGRPAPAGPSGFGDVSRGAFYDDAIAWMAQHRITTGVSGTNRFEPEARVTRGELVTFLYRLARTASAWSGPVPSTVLF
ncbi:S-layer homology domain-containing protein [Actinomarinicola tropica]|uniref:SLH domain-containing protein n=1 Tax=Actinomarinicola tropica TaxID=2789776 RepID=A0A5Q2RK44_9ACTN|nr:S-layer homology domain-containing protein [Actinomarinicola tropica]QGG95854.1 hypothetical protein GH723_12515 [Actinomarinicola tropica]